MMANLISTGSHLLQSGDYSDFTFLCDNEEIKAHKSIVCPQSAVITAALNGGFQEAETSTISVDFDLNTLKCMLEYMYTSDYPEKPAINDPPQPTSTKAVAQEGTDSSKKDGNNNSDAEAFSKAMLYHTRVNGIADYYGVSTLVKLSSSRVEDLLVRQWSAKAFYDTIQDAFNLTGDTNLRRIIVNTAASHISELASKNVFTEEKVADDITSEIFRASLGLFKSTTRELQAANCKISTLEVEIKVEQMRSRALQTNLCELALSSNRSHTCSNTRFTTACNYNIRRLTSGGSNWILQCTACNQKI